MYSKIKIDTDNQGLPFIRMDVSHDISDLRDKTISRFADQAYRVVGMRSLGENTENSVGYSSYEIYPFDEQNKWPYPVWNFIAKQLQIEHEHGLEWKNHYTNETFELTKYGFVKKEQYIQIVDDLIVKTQATSNGRMFLFLCDIDNHQKEIDHRAFCNKGEYIADHKGTFGQVVNVSEYCIEIKLLYSVSNKEFFTPEDFEVNSVVRKSKDISSGVSGED